MDEEFLENDDDYLLGENPPKINERCKYWPACKNGDKCEYHHPVTTCKYVDINVLELQMF